MIKRLSGILFLSVSVMSLAFAAPPASAKSSPDIETEEETSAIYDHRAMLLAGRYDRLDAEMNRLQREYEEGKRDDISLMHFFRAFSAYVDPALERKYDAWIKAYPQSYAARQARAIYLRQRIFKIFEGHADGSQYTPPEKSEFNKLVEAALADSKTAAQMVAKPYLSYDNMIQIGWMTRNYELCRKMLDLANKIDPGNFVARLSFMPTLETRWGGSLQQMLDFRAEVAKALPTEWLVNFDDLIEYDRSWQDGEENQKDYELLKTGQYQPLDEKMNRFQKEYEEGKRDDSSIDRLYNPFRYPEPDMEPRYQAWIEAYPQSYAAHQARAEYYFKLGLKARGIQYMNKTSEKEVSGMHRYLGMAMDDDKIAVSLTAKPILTYQNILDIAKFTGADELCREMLELSIKADPDNYIVRYQYLSTLQGRWGGSLELMEKFVKESREAGLSRRHIDYFEDQVLEEKIWQRYNANERNKTIGQLQTGL